MTQKRIGQRRDKMNIKLKDFIAQSLKEIIDAVNDTQKYAINLDAKVNPKSQSRAAKDQIRVNDFYDSFTNRYGQFVEFDIAVTATKNEKEDEGIGVSVIPLGLFKKWSKSFFEASVSRIKFAIPIVLPIQETEKELAAIEAEKKSEIEKKEREAYEKRKKINREY